MKKLAIAAALTGALVLPVQAGATHTLRHVGAQLRAVQAELNCLVRYGVSEYTGYAWYEDNGDVHVLQDTESFSDSLLALNLDVATGVPGASDVWVVAVRNTAACKRKFGVGANPYAGRVAAAARVNYLRLARLERAL
jgi:hypothetical protein